MFLAFNTQSGLEGTSPEFPSSLVMQWKGLCIPAAGIKEAEQFRKEGTSPGM